MYRLVSAFFFLGAMAGVTSVSAKTSEYEPFVPQDTITLVPSQTIVQWPSEGRGGSFVFTDASNSNYQWQLEFDKFEALNFDEYDFIYSMSGYQDITDPENPISYSIEQASGNYWLDAQTLILHMNGIIAMSDGHAYQISIEHQVVANNTINISYNNLESYSAYGATSYQCSTDESYIDLLVWENVSEFDSQNTSFEYYFTNGEFEVEQVKLLSGKVSVDPTTYHDVLDLTFFADDWNIYKVHATHTVPAVKDSIEITLTNIDLRDYREKRESIQINGYSADRKYFFQLCPVSENIAGSYTYRDLKENIDLCYLIEEPEDETGYETYYYVEAAAFTITINGDKYTLKGSYQAENIKVKLDLSGEIKLGGIDGDCETNGIQRVYTTDDVVGYETDDYFESIAVRFVDNKYAFTLEFINVDLNDPMVIPAGTYNIREDYNSTTDPIVYSGSMLYDVLYGSYIGTRIEGEETLFNAPFWFLESGTVTVTHQNDQLKIVVDALNSFKHSIEVTFEGTIPVTGIQTLHPTDNQHTGKQMRQGQLLIEKNGKCYNASGVVLR